MTEPAEVRIDALTKADAVRCAELEAQLFAGDDPWPPVAFVHGIAGKHNHYIAAREGDRLVGYAGISRLGRIPPYEYEVHTIGVDPTCQGRGIGRALLERIEQDIREHGHAEVALDAVLPGIPLYGACGYRPVARTELVLPDGVRMPVVSMRKSLA